MDSRTSVNTSIGNIHGGEEDWEERSRQSYEDHLSEPRETEE